MSNTKIATHLSEDSILAELGSRLAAARLAKNLTQASLAEEAGVSKRTVERLEAGEVASRLSAFVRICRALGLVDRLDLLVPAPTLSPVAQLKLAGKRRQRASGQRAVTPRTKGTWTWGDDT